MKKKILILTVPLCFVFSGCVKEYNENMVYGSGLNKGRYFDENALLIEKEAIEFNKERTSILDEYFDARAKEILKD